MSPDRGNASQCPALAVTRRGLAQPHAEFCWPHASRARRPRRTVFGTGTGRPRRVFTHFPFFLFILKSAIEPRRHRDTEKDGERCSLRVSVPPWFTSLCGIWRKTPGLGRSPV